MGQSRRNKLLAVKGGHLLMSVLGVQVAYSVVMLSLLGTGSLDSLTSRVLRGLLVVDAGLLIISAFYALWRDRKTRRSDRSRIRRLRHLIDGVLHPPQEWWWATDDRGTFTYSSSTSLALLGYAPSELEGQPAGIVMDLDDLAKARHSTAAAMASDGSSWDGVIVRCRHRDGSPVWMEVSGHARPAIHGISNGFEGSSKPLLQQNSRVLAVQPTRERIEQMLRERALLTAFQPNRHLATGAVIGVEALARFADGNSPEHWFSQAETVGLTAEHEFAALEAALTAAEELPSHLYVAVNLSPEPCPDPRLTGILAASRIAPKRLVLELTENLPVAEYDPLVDALATLRRRGMRIAVDDAGAGFSSLRHILQLQPDIIKLDRSLIAGINQAPRQGALGAGMVEFANQTRAQLVAERLETEAELLAVTTLGMHAGQGFLLGRPTADPQAWATWQAPNTPNCSLNPPAGRRGEVHPAPIHHPSDGVLTSFGK